MKYNNIKIKEGDLVLCLKDSTITHHESAKKGKIYTALHVISSYEIILKEFAGVADTLYNIKNFKKIKAVK